FSGVKKFARKVKQTVTENVSALRQGGQSEGTSGSSSIADSLSGVFQSVKNGSIAVGKQIAQTAESLLTKNTERIDVQITPTQIKYILDNLESGFNDTCVVKNAIQLDYAIIQKGFSPYSIQGVIVDGCELNLIRDVLYMVRHFPLIILQFTNTPMPHPSNPSSLNLYQCALFLLSHYDTLLAVPAGSLRRAVISNHFLTLRTLSHINPALDLSAFLCPSDPEHLLVAERLFLSCLRTAVPRPLFSLPGAVPVVPAVPANHPPTTPTQPLTQPLTQPSQQPLQQPQQPSQQPLQQPQQSPQQPLQQPQQSPQQTAASLRESVPAHLKSTVDFALVFCAAVAAQHHALPDPEIAAVLSPTPSPAAFASLVASWPYPA
ncbi:hypothetical protein WA556_001937, partial [Blastocystis sp. ATCC 50177/Nand II]